MKILILNWRSVKDPLAGGAEQATFELAKRWVQHHKAQITWISPPYDTKIENEILHGVNFKYIGRPLAKVGLFKMLIFFPFFYILCILEYLKNFKNNVNIVIDQSHGFPFLTPLYVKERKILYLHEVADIIWDKMFPFPINKFGKSIERIFLRLYKFVKTITVSEGTKKDLVNLGLNPKNIKIVVSGINLKPIYKPIKKFDSFTILFLNRVVRMKGPDTAIDIFAEVSKLVPDSKLIIAGKYDELYKKELEDKINRLNVKNIEFKGFVTDEEKIDLLQKSHVLINTSIKEGWGIVNIEANSQGTPVVAFNVEGCKESVKNGVSGYLVENNNEFVEKIIRLQNEDLQQKAIEYSKQFSYDEKSEEFWKEINEQ